MPVRLSMSLPARLEISLRVRRNFAVGRCQMSKVESKAVCTLLPLRIRLVQLLHYMGSYLLLQSTGEEKRPSGGDEGKNISCDNERLDM